MPPIKLHGLASEVSCSSVRAIVSDFFCLLSSSDPSSSPLSHWKHPNCIQVCCSCFNKIKNFMFALCKNTKSLFLPLSPFISMSHFCLPAPALQLLCNPAGSANPVSPLSRTFLSKKMCLSLAAWVEGWCGMSGTRERNLFLRLGVQILHTYCVHHSGSYFCYYTTKTVPESSLSKDLAWKPDILQGNFFFASHSYISHNFWGIPFALVVPLVHTLSLGAVVGCVCRTAQKVTVRHVCLFWNWLHSGRTAAGPGAPILTLLLVVLGEDPSSLLLPILPSTWERCLIFAFLWECIWCDWSYWLQMSLWFFFRCNFAHNINY